MIASGTDPITYQWQLNGNNISGATASALLITSANAANAGVYTCIITNSAGTVTTSPSTLVVSNPPVITASPVAAQSVAAGTTVNLSVSVSDPTSVTYQWQFNGVNIFGASSPNLILNSVTAANAGSYVCVVSNLVGVTTSTPSVLNITSLGSPTIQQIQPPKQLLLDLVLFLRWLLNQRLRPLIIGSLTELFYLELHPQRSIYLQLRLLTPVTTLVLFQIHRDM